MKTYIPRTILKKNIEHTYYNCSDIREKLIRRKDLGTSYSVKDWITKRRLEKISSLWKEEVFEVSEKVHNTLNQAQKLFYGKFTKTLSGMDNAHPLVFLLGRKRKLINCIVPFQTHGDSGGCGEMPKLWTSEITVIMQEMVLSGFEVVGLVRVGNFSICTMGNIYGTYDRHDMDSDIGPVYRNIIDMNIPQFYFVSVGTLNKGPGIRIQKIMSSGIIEDVKYKARIKKRSMEDASEESNKKESRKKKSSKEESSSQESYW